MGEIRTGRPYVGLIDYIAQNTQSPMPSDPILDGLTPAQQAAVTHVEGPLLVLAGPGSGKTRVVTHRIAYLIEQGIPGREILALTFTNKAAEEMTRRLDQLTPGHNVWMGTFHRFCARLLRNYADAVGFSPNYTIYDVEDARRVVRRLLSEVMGVSRSSSEKGGKGSATPAAVYSAISSAKNRLVMPDEYHSRPGHAVGMAVECIYPLYQQTLLDANAVDFDDLLLHVVSLLRHNPEIRRSLDERFRFVLVDEYQDTNSAQYIIAKALSIEHPNLAVTGDPDQSIYGWRGANLNNILDFEKDYPNVKTVRLEQNYRSTQRILSAADTLIARNVRRKAKTLFTENPEGKRVRLVCHSSHADEAAAVADVILEEVETGRRFKDFAVFYRVNALSRAVEDALRERRIPYQIVRGLEFYQRREVKDVLAYLKVVNNPRDEGSLLRIINTPARRIGKATIEKVLAHAREHGLSVLEAVFACKSIPTLKKQTASNVAKFADLMARLSDTADRPVEELLGLVLSETGYVDELEDSGSEEDMDRAANVRELLTVARQFDETEGDPESSPLERFLEEVSLVSDTDDWEEDDDRVTLMTLHASKGLEFPVVFIIGVEQGLLPHERCLEDPDQLEEERRLLFVGITRAEEELELNYATTREFAGRRKLNPPSMFLMDLPREEMDLVGIGYSSLAYADPLGTPRQQAFSPRGEGIRLTTGAAMLGETSEPAKQFEADAVAQGTFVMHNSHGLGRVIALGGTGDSRHAVVRFGNGAKFTEETLPVGSLTPLK